MSTINDDTGEAAVAFVSGVLIGLAATFLYMRIRNKCRDDANNTDDDYYYDGGDLFI